MAYRPGATFRRDLIEGYWHGRRIRLGAMKHVLWAAAVGGWLMSGCGGADVSVPQNQSITGVDDGAQEDAAPKDPRSDAPGEGDTGEDGLVGDPNATGPAPSGESDPGEQAAAGGIFPNNSLVECTANLNLRSGPSASSSVLRTVPDGSVLRVVNGVASNGFIKVEHNGLRGYAAYRYLQAAAGGTSSGAGTSGTVRDQAVSVAQTGVGFSYWWGFGKWLPSGATSSNKGRCTGSCPSCSHAGEYGADCSGYIAKIWKVPSSNTNVAVNSHPYSTADFFGGTGGGQWSNVSKSAMQKGDVLVYRSGGAGHMALYEKGDAWGQPWAYEARGCSYGIVHNVRSFGSGFKGIKRTGW